MVLQRLEQNGRHFAAAVHSTAAPHCGQATMRDGMAVATTSIL